MWPAGTKLKVIKHGNSGHYITPGSIVTFGGVNRKPLGINLYACIVDPKDLQVGSPHDCNGFFKEKIGRNFYRDELEPVLIPEDEDDLYI